MDHHVFCSSADRWDRRKTKIVEYLRGQGHIVIDKDTSIVDVTAGDHYSFYVTTIHITGIGALRQVPKGDTIHIQEILDRLDIIGARVQESIEGKIVAENIPIEGVSSDTDQNKGGKEGTVADNGDSV